MKKIWTTLKIVISAAILLYLLFKANLAEGVHNLGEIRPTYLLISIALIVAGQVVRAQRLAALVFGEEGRAKFWPVLRIQMISFLPGVISPVKVGEATKIFMLQSELDVPIERGLVCFATERVLDLLLLCPLAAMGIYVFYRAGLDFHLEAGWKGLLLSAVGVSVAAILLGILFMRSRDISFSTIRRAATPRNIVKASGFTVVYWLIVFLEVWCFCKASAFDANVIHMALVVPTSLLSSLLPITFSGFGVREFVMTFLLQRPPVGAGYEQALMVSLMYDIVGLGVPAIMGALFWVTRKTNGA